MNSKYNQIDESANTYYTCVRKCSIIKNSELFDMLN